MFILQLYVSELYKKIDINQILVTSEDSCDGCEYIFYDKYSGDGGIIVNDLRALVTWKNLLAPRKLKKKGWL